MLVKAYLAIFVGSFEKSFSDGNVFQNNICRMRSHNTVNFYFPYFKVSKDLYLFALNLKIYQHFLQTSLCISYVIFVFVEKFYRIHFLHFE